MSDPLTTFPALYGVFHYVPLHKVRDALELGWMPTDALEGTHHAMHAVMCWWPCQCKMVLPL